MSDHPIDARYELAAELADVQARLAERENMIRDLCISHVDDCWCRYCTAVFSKPANSAGESEHG